MASLHTSLRFQVPLEETTDERPKLAKAINMFFFCFAPCKVVWYNRVPPPLHFAVRHQSNRFHLLKRDEYAAGACP